MTEWQHHTVHTNGVRLHYVEAGTGPLVLLLHGFPEFWYGWRHQIPALAATGFRVVAPDMRGYNQSSKPSGIANYRMERLVEDVVGLTHHLGEERGVPNLRVERIPEATHWVQHEVPDRVNELLAGFLA